MMNWLRDLCCLGKHIHPKAGTPVAHLQWLSARPRQVLLPKSFPFCALVADISHKPSALSAQSLRPSSSDMIGQGKVRVWDACRCTGTKSTACAEHQQVGPLLHWALQPGYHPGLPATHGRPDWIGPCHHAAHLNRPSTSAHQV